MADLYQSPDHNDSAAPHRASDASRRSNGARPAQHRSSSASRRGRRKKDPWRTVGKVVGTFLLVCLTTSLLLVCFAAVYINSVIVPEAQRQDYLGNMSTAQTSIMYYTDESGNDQPYLTLSSDQNRKWVSYDDLEKTYLVDALIAIEDKRFYDHNGVDWLRTGRGVLNMFTGGSIQGGSTLTQQLIKNITGETKSPSSARSWRSSGPWTLRKTTLKSRSLSGI